MLSMYSPEKKFTVYCRECWYGDDWDPLSYGAEYYWDKPFFEQYQELMERVPRIALVFYHTNINADYANFIADNKNIYLAFSVVESENVYYSRSVDKSKECIDCLNIAESEICYGNVDGARNYQCRYIVRSRDCINSSFLFDCANCQNCFLSSNLRNKQFVFRNQQLSRDQYQVEIHKLNLGKYSNLVILKKEFKELIKSSLHKFANLVKTTNCTGDNIGNSKNVKYSFDAYEAEDVKFSGRVLMGFKDGYDVYGAGLTSQLIYEGVATGKSSYNVKFFTYTDASKDLSYCDWCHSSSNLFGCVSLRKKEYCILNKQYSKEEFEKLLPKIVEHLNTLPYKDKVGRVYKYGEFFPMELSPWTYNETIAEEYFPMEKEDAYTQGYGWRDPDPYPHKPTLNSVDLSDDIKETEDSIVNEIIGCASCGRAYRIINPELEFLRQQNIPLPRECQDCRYKERFALRNPLKLWHRQCMCDYQIYKNSIKHPYHLDSRCPNEFETSYAPERPEVIYCEACYNAEVV